MSAEGLFKGLIGFHAAIGTLGVAYLVYIPPRIVNFLGAGTPYYAGLQISLLTIVIILVAYIMIFISLVKKDIKNELATTDQSKGHVQPAGEGDSPDQVETDGGRAQSYDRTPSGWGTLGGMIAGGIAGYPNGGIWVVIGAIIGGFFGNLFEYLLIKSYVANMRPGAKKEGPTEDSDLTDPSEEGNPVDEGGSVEEDSVEDARPQEKVATVVRDTDIFASREVGEEYRGSVYRELAYDELEVAAESPSYPVPGRGGNFRTTDLPKVPKVSHIVGPSAIMLGASLGSGETMFWPTLVAQNGWGLYWAFWVGVITQFFINTELQRWTIATGESIFRAFDRIHGIWPWFFLVTGFFHLGWPGWAAGASEVLAVWTGIVPRSEWWIIGLVSMVFIWLTYQAGPVAYNIVENFQVVLMIIAVITASVLVVVVGSIGQLASVPAGAVNFGALPQDMDIAVFLGGLAYAGAGGYINLSQGVWAREKGYGMGTYQGRVKNPLRDAESEDVHGGFTFDPTEKNLRRWKAWWKVTQQEHFLSFVLGLLIVATIVMTIPAEYARGADVGAIDMWLNVVIPELGGVSATLLYAVLFIALFSTQYAIFESFVRNSVDILYEGYGRKAGWDLSRTFLGLMTIFTLWGIVVIGVQFQQPWILLVIGAAIAGVMMWPYNALTVILNTTRLPEHTQPKWGRVVAMWWATGFFGYFSILLIGDTLVSRVGLDAFLTTVNVVDSAIGGYALWVLFLVVQVYTMYRSFRGKVDASGTVENSDDARGFLA